MADTQGQKVNTDPGKITMMPEGNATLEQNKQIARRFIDELLNHNNIQVLPEIMAKDACMIHPISGKPIQGIDEIRRLLEGFHAGFPDFKVQIEALFAEGDHVAFEVRCQGTQDGVFFNHPPTHRQLNWIALNIMIIRQGKIVEHRACDTVLLQLQEPGRTL